MKIQTNQEHPFRTLWLDADVDTRRKWADRAGTSYRYLQKLSAKGMRFGSPSIEFLLHLRKTAVRGLDVEHYYPAWAKK